MRHITMIIAVLALAIAAPAIAGKGNGNGNGKNGGGSTGGGGGGNNVTASGSCSVEGNVVTGSNLPNWTLLNFMVTDSSGTSGWVLGQTDNGTWAVDVPNRNGATTYEFAGVTYGKDGTKYAVYASCSA